MTSSGLPTKLQSLTSSVLLILFSFTLAPLSLAFTSFVVLTSPRCLWNLVTSLLFSLFPSSSSSSFAPSNLLTRRRQQTAGSNGAAAQRAGAGDGRPTVLINGGRMQKCLYMARAFAKRGYRVVVVEEQGWGLLSPARFSSLVSDFVLVPTGGGPRYITALVDVAVRYDVDLFVPCSGAGTTGEDAVAAATMRKRLPGLRAIIMDPDLVRDLHEKDRFIDLVHSLDLDAPDSELCYSVEELMALLRKGGPPRILKCAAELDDVGRSDLTLYPFQKQQQQQQQRQQVGQLKPRQQQQQQQQQALSKHSSPQPDWEATEKRLRSLPIPITAQTPYIAQEFIGGTSTSEWCTHSTIIDGQVRAFVCCPSNDMLMTYYPAVDHPIGRRTLEWTRAFIARLQEREEWKGKALDGHYSFDFIHQPDPEPEGSGVDGEAGNSADDTFFLKGRLVAIECNPRVHTAVGLVTPHEDFVRAYEVDGGGRGRESEHSGNGNGVGSKKVPSTNGSSTTNGSTRKDATTSPSLSLPILPAQTARPMSWLAHDVPARLLPQLLPLPLRRSIHPLWLSVAESQSQSQASSPSPSRPQPFDLNSPGQADASWDATDPLPTLAFYHLTWPYLLLRQLVVGLLGKGRGWSRINVSTARIFEC